MEKFNLTSFKTTDELASHVASLWLDEIEKPARAGRRHCVALSGGRITKNLFNSVVQQAQTRATLFESVHFFWADERYLPSDDPESNFRLAQEQLFAPLGIHGNQIHRIRGEDTPEVCVKSAEEELCRIAPHNSAGCPTLDLVLLGMGEDGHVASLFPNTPAKIANHSDPFVFIDHSPKPPPRRVSLSYTAIAAARLVWVLISGPGKEAALRESLSSGKTPLGRVIQSRQNTWIFSQIEAVEKI